MKMHMSFENRAICAGNLELIFLVKGIHKITKSLPKSKIGNTHMAVIVTLIVTQALMIT